jgi:energy-coupling factor transporter ATP-binding protein EcfA2
MVELTRLKIEKFRNVAPTELRFNDGFNVLLGQNGTGKTTLLKLVAMASSSKFSPLRHTEFALEYELALSTIDVTITLSNRPSKLGINSAADTEILPRISPQGESMAWSYDIEVREKSTSATYRTSVSSGTRGGEQEVSQQRYRQLTRELNPFDSQFVFFAVFGMLRRGPKEQSSLTQHVISELLFMDAGRLDEGLGGFAAMIGVAAESESAELGNAQGSVEKMEGQGAGYSFNFVPSPLMSKIMSLEDRPPSIISISDTEMKFLEKAVSTMQFTHGELLVELLSKDVNDRASKLTYGRFGFRFTLDDGSIISHQALSYGQKRLLSFLYYSAAFDNIVVADELVNGLHHEWIEVCLREIGDRQAFLTSQNPLLLDFLSFESAEKVERTFILCCTEKFIGKNRMVWSNLSNKDTNRFYRAYEAGIQHVSDILRTKGLW